MIERRAGGWRVVAPMVLANAASLLAAGDALVDSSPAVVDLGGVEAADSSAIAVLLAWARAADARGGCLSFRNAPAGLTALAALYDLDGILPLA